MSGTPVALLIAALALLAAGAWAQDRWPRSLAARFGALAGGSILAGVWLQIFLLA